jgi:hypothetical protein
VVLAVLGLFVAVSSLVANDGQYFPAAGASAGNLKHQAVTRSDRSLLTKFVERSRVDLGTGGASGLAPGPAAVSCVVAQQCRIVAIESLSPAIPVRFFTIAQPRAPPAIPL